VEAGEARTGQRLVTRAAAVGAIVAVLLLLTAVTFGARWEQGPSGDRSHATHVTAVRSHTSSKAQTGARAAVLALGVALLWWHLTRAARSRALATSWSGAVRRRGPPQLIAY
jgi:hypothetical protein